MQFIFIQNSLLALLSPTTNFNSITPCLPQSPRPRVQVSQDDKRCRCTSLNEKDSSFSSSAWPASSAGFPLAINDCKFSSFSFICDNVVASSSSSLSSTSFPAWGRGGGGGVNFALEFLEALSSQILLLAVVVAAAAVQALLISSNSAIVELLSMVVRVLSWPYSTAGVEFSGQERQTSAQRPIPHSPRDERGECSSSLARLN